MKIKFHMERRLVAIRELDEELGLTELAGEYGAYSDKKTMEPLAGGAAYSSPVQDGKEYVFHVLENTGAFLMVVRKARTARIPQLTVDGIRSVLPVEIARNSLASEIPPPATPGERKSEDTRIAFSHAENGIADRTVYTEPEGLRSLFISSIALTSM